MNKNLVQQFVDQSVIAKGDYELLDILWILHYSLPSKTAYKDHKDTFKRWLGITCRRNLEKKHYPLQSEIKDKMNILIGFLNSVPDFLNYDSYYDDEELLHSVLKVSTSSMLMNDTEKRVSKVIPSELESKILSFILHYIPEKISESQQKADEFKAINQSFNDKYMTLHDFRILEDKAGGIAHFIINIKEWNFLFNKIFNTDLKEFKFKVKSLGSKSTLLILAPYEQYDKYSFWQFGDELVKLGVGYWVSLLSAKGNISLEFIIPKFVYDAIQPHKEQLPKIEGIATIASSIEAEKQKDEWCLGDVTEAVESVSDFSESEIEHSIISNPGILGNSLKIVGNQFPTDVGFIDILCEDGDGNYVVVELKKGVASFEVVGQIQKYMSWVHENLAGTKQVRGIIVAKENDKQLEYAAKGSKFMIEIKVFGAEAPIQPNIKYCDSCGKPNKKSAKHCVRCGKEFWL